MEPIEQRGRVATVFNYIAIVCDGLFIYAIWRLISVLDAVSTGDVDPLVAATTARSLLLALAVWLIVCIAAFITFAVWFHRAHKNLALGGLVGMNYSPGWAVGGFFVPFLHFVRPYSVMKEVSKGSRYLADRAEAARAGTEPALDGDLDGGEAGWLSTEPDDAVQIWWACVIAVYVLNFISSVTQPRNPEPETMSTAMWFMLLTIVMAIPAQLYTIKLIRTISAQQEKAREAQAAHAGGLM